MKAACLFNGALEISGRVDEESGGFSGMGYLAERGYFSKPRVHHIIIPEPLDVDRICLALFLPLVQAWRRVCGSTHDAGTHKSRSPQTPRPAYTCQPIICTPPNAHKSTNVLHSTQQT